MLDKKKSKFSGTGYSEEKDKRFLMWSGTIFFMILIIFLWFLSMKTFFAGSESKNVDDGFKFNELAAEFYGSMEELSASFKELQGSIEELEASSTEKNEIEEPESDNTEENSQLNIDKSTTTEDEVSQELPEEVENSAS